MDAEIRAALCRVSTATLTTQLFKRGLRGMHMTGVQPMSSGRRLVGEATTLRCIPSREDLDVVEAFDDPAHPQRRAFELIKPGQVLVIDARGVTRAAAAGHILITRLMRRGAAGIVTDGALRDSVSYRDMDLPVYAAGGSPALNLVMHHAVDIDVPVGCGGVPVFPGDVVVGDEEGVVVIPRHLAGEVAQDALAQERLERFVLGKIRAGAPLPGTYPPDADTLREYRSWKDDPEPRPDDR